MTTEAAPRTLHWYDHIFVNANWFALTLRSQVLAGLIVPLLVQGFVGEEQKGSYYGTIRLWALMTALLTQALFGLLSDHSRLRWGRRRPFVFAGAVLEVFAILSMAWIAGMQGMAGYTLLFVVYLGSMIFSNMSQGGTQGLIPDVVPQEKRGISSGVKMLLEVPLPLLMLGLVIAPMISKGNMTGGIAVTCLCLLACMGLTMFVREPRPTLLAREPLNWRPFISLLLMTSVSTAIVLGIGEVVKLLMPVLGDAPGLVFGAVGVVAMLLAVILGIFASLGVHLDSAVRKNRPFTWLVISRLAALVAINNIASFLLYFVQEKFNLPGKEAAGLAGTLPMVLGGFVIIFGLVAGWLSDRFDRRQMTSLGGIAGAIGVAVMIAGATMPLMYVAAAIIGLAYALFNVASWALGTDIVPKERAGEFLGIQNLAGAGAGAIGAYIGGTIADHSGYVLMMVMFGVMFLLSSGAALCVRIEKAKPA